MQDPDICPRCGKRSMPPWDSPYVTARRCQDCGNIEERDQKKPPAGTQASQAVKK